MFALLRVLFVCIYACQWRCVTVYSRTLSFALWFEKDTVQQKQHVRTTTQRRLGLAFGFVVVVGAILCAALCDDTKRHGYLDGGTRSSVYASMFVERASSDGATALG